MKKFVLNVKKKLKYLTMIECNRLWLCKNCDKVYTSQLRDITEPFEKWLKSFKK